MFFWMEVSQTSANSGAETNWSVSTPIIISSRSLAAAALPRPTGPATGMMTSQPSSNKFSAKRRPSSVELEVTGEHAILAWHCPSRAPGCRPPSADCSRSTPFWIADHEVGHRRDVDAAEGANRAGLAHARRQVAGQERRLAGVEQQALDVLSAAGRVDDRELGVRIGFGGRLGRIRQQEADRDDQVLVLREELVDVLLIVGLLLALQEHAVDAQVFMASWTPFQAVWLKDLSSMPPMSVTWPITNLAASVGSGATGRLRRFGRFGGLGGLRSFGRFHHGRRDLGGWYSSGCCFCDGQAARTIAETTRTASSKYRRFCMGDSPPLGIVRLLIFRSVRSLETGPISLG